MAALPQPRWTAEQYLELERASEIRHEFYRGEMFAMAGASLAHGMIVMNFGSELRSALRKSSCQVVSTDLRVQISKNESYTYPDIVIVCDPPAFHDDRSDTLLNPAVLIEVLSPSTEAYDRGLKSAQYRTVASLKEYVLVSQFEARVEVFRRQEGGGWLLTEAVGLEDVCKLPSLGCEVPLAEIYSKVEFSGTAFGREE